MLYKVTGGAVIAVREKVCLDTTKITLGTLISALTNHHYAG